MAVTYNSYDELISAHNQQNIKTFISNLNSGKNYLLTKVQSSSGGIDVDKWENIIAGAFTIFKDADISNIPSKSRIDTSKSPDLLTINPDWVISNASSDRYPNIFKNVRDDVQDLIKGINYINSRHIKAYNEIKSGYSGFTSPYISPSEKPSWQADNVWRTIKDTLALFETKIQNAQASASYSLYNSIYSVTGYASIKAQNDSLESVNIVKSELMAL